MDGRQRRRTMFKSPAVRRNVDVLLDQVPNCRRHNQSHQFCAPIPEEKSFHWVKAWYPVPAKCLLRCFLLDRFRAAAVQKGVSRTAPV